MSLVDYSAQSRASLYVGFQISGFIEIRPKLCHSGYPRNGQMSIEWMMSFGIGQEWADEHWAKEVIQDIPDQILV